MQSDHLRLALIGLALAGCGGALMLSHWVLPAWPSVVSGIGAFPLVIGLLLLGVAEEQWRSRRTRQDPEAPTAAPHAASSDLPHD